jgi:hypothetical protein
MLEERVGTEDTEEPRRKNAYYAPNNTREIRKAAFEDFERIFEQVRRLAGRNLS